MFYDYRFAPFLILLCVGFVATLRGLMVLKTRTMEVTVPFGSEARLDGTAATWAGAGLVALGLLSFTVLAALVISLAG